MTPEGILLVESRFGPAETADRLVGAITSRGMTVMARVDHAEAAARVGLELRPTEVVIFGNPRAGTLLMQKTQTIGIDLPLKALIWQDAEARTWVAYNDPHWLARRHSIGSTADAVVAAMSNSLEAIAKEAAGAST